MLSNVESVERKELIINIEITILEREINTPNISEQEKSIKREKLIQLYEETGDLQKAIYERVILEKWDRIYEIKANKRNFKLIWTIAAFISTGDPEYRDSMIDMYSKHIKHVHNQDAKEQSKKHLEDYVEKIYNRWIKKDWVRSKKDLIGMNG